MKNDVINHLLMHHKSQHKKNNFPHKKKTHCIVHPVRAFTLKTLAASEAAVFTMPSAIPSRSVFWRKGVTRVMYLDPPQGWSKLGAQSSVSPPTLSRIRSNLFNNLIKHLIKATAKWGYVDLVTPHNKAGQSHCRCRVLDSFLNRKMQTSQKATGHDVRVVWCRSGEQEGQSTPSVPPSWVTWFGVWVLGKTEEQVLDM